MVALSQQWEMTQWYVLERVVKVELAFQAFGISQICYLCKAKLDVEKNFVAD
jgi:hypothetical protein